MIHKAGKPDGLVQRCEICGEILLSYKNVSGIGNWTPSFWEGYVEIIGFPRVMAHSEGPETCGQKNER
jgi:hypothetical protein